MNKYKRKTPQILLAVQTSTLTIAMMSTFFLSSMAHANSTITSITDNKDTLADNPDDFSGGSSKSRKTSKDNGLKIGINAMYSDKGFTEYDNDVAILPSFFYDNGKVYARGNSVGYNLIKDKKNELSGFIQYTGSSYNPDNAHHNLTKLDERDSSIFAGASYMHLTPYGALRAQIATDVMDTSDGTLARLSYLARYNNEKLTLYPSLGLQWQDENYNDYYYGINKQESTTSGIVEYSPKDSIHPYVSIMGMYELSDEWGLFLNQNMSYNTDEQYNSPKIESRSSHTTTLGVTYSF